MRIIDATSLAHVARDLAHAAWAATAATAAVAVAHVGRS